MADLIVVDASVLYESSRPGHWPPCQPQRLLTPKIMRHPK